jgi:hypothetical protein
MICVNYMQMHAFARMNGSVSLKITFRPATV